MTLFRRYWREGERTILRADRGEPVVMEPDEPLIIEGVVHLSFREVSPSGSV